MDDEIQLQIQETPDIEMPDVVEIQGEMPELELVVEPEPAPLTQADYEFIDEIITFENDGTLMTCDPNFYKTAVIILKKVVDIGMSIAKNSGNYDDNITMAKIGLLMSAMYFWSNDFTQKSSKQLKLLFMDATCFEQYGNVKELKIDIQKFQKYLCFVVFIAKGQEFDSKESFFIEWMSYSDHKKNLINILVSTCLQHVERNKRKQIIMPKFNFDTGSNRFHHYVRDVYTDFDGTVFNTYYDYYLYATTKESDLMFSAIESTIKQPPIKQPTTKSKQTKGSRKESAVCDVPEVCVASNMKENPVCAVPDVCVVANKTKKNRGPKVEPKVEPTEEDDTGFTMVKQREIQFRYLLKSQDYDIIKTHTLTIMQPICVGFDGRLCLSIFKDKMSGKYIDIFIGGIQAAHISYYHHSKDQYHFKIDNHATFDLSLPPSLKQYTVPFNFHINPATRQLTFAIRQIDNPNTEEECTDRGIIQMVRDILTNHINALQRVVQERVVQVGLGYKPRKSKRCNRRDKRCKITRRPRPRRRL